MKNDEALPTPSLMVTVSNKFTIDPSNVSVRWSPDSDRKFAGTVYTATVSIVPNEEGQITLIDEVGGEHTITPEFVFSPSVKSTYLIKDSNTTGYANVNGEGIGATLSAIIPSNSYRIDGVPETLGTVEVSNGTSIEAIKSQYLDQTITVKRSELDVNGNVISGPENATYEISWTSIEREDGLPYQQKSGDKQVLIARGVLVVGNGIVNAPLNVTKTIIVNEATTPAEVTMWYTDESGNSLQITETSEDNPFTFEDSQEVSISPVDGQENTMISVSEDGGETWELVDKSYNLIYDGDDSVRTLQIKVTADNRKTSTYDLVYKPTKSEGAPDIVANIPNVNAEEEIIDANVKLDPITEDMQNIEYDVYRGNFPFGLVLNTDGTITGAPLDPGTYTFVVEAKYTVGEEEKVVYGRIIMTVGETTSKYEFIEGIEQTWQKGTLKKAHFVTNGLYDLFIGIKIDGKEVDSSNYDSYSGSTHIELHKEYLETLSVGKHTIEAFYRNHDEKIETVFYITSNGKTIIDNNNKNANTGDTSNQAAWMITLFGSLLVLISALFLKKKHS